MFGVWGECECACRCRGVWALVGALTFMAAIFSKVSVGEPKAPAVVVDVMLPLPYF